LMTNLVPVTRYGSRWSWDELTRSAVWSEGASLQNNLAAVLRRRLLDSQSGKGQGLPLLSFYGASFTDLLMLWSAQLDESRLAVLVRALALVDFGNAPSHENFQASQAKSDPTPSLAQSGVWFTRRDAVRLTIQPSGVVSSPEQEAAFALPRAYALLKLCFLGGRLPAAPQNDRNARRSGNEPLPSSPLRLLNLLLAGRGSEAVQTAGQMLRTKGYVPIVRNETLASGEWTLSQDDSKRMAGMLLIPVRQPAVLAALSIKPISN
jgi:hypothetical protein